METNNYFINFTEIGDVLEENSDHQFGHFLQNPVLPDLSEMCDEIFRHENSLLQHELTPEIETLHVPETGDNDLVTILDLSENSLTSSFNAMTPLASASSMALSTLNVPAQNLDNIPQDICRRHSASFNCNPNFTHGSNVWSFQDTSQNATFTTMFGQMSLEEEANGVELWSTYVQPSYSLKKTDGKYHVGENAINSYSISHSREQTEFLNAPSGSLESVDNENQDSSSEVIKTLYGFQSKKVNKNKCSTNNHYNFTIEAGEKSDQDYYRQDNLEFGALKKIGYRHETCGQLYPQNQNPQGNYRNYQAEYICNSNGLPFEPKTEQYIHPSTHSGERNNSYKPAGQKFALRGSSKQFFTLTEYKPHRCKQCGLGFGQKRYLDQHLLTHTGEKPHQCEMCGKSFLAKGNLKAHLKIHTGEKPYQCEYCDKRFLTKSDLKKHLRTHTNKYRH